ncbi:MAG: hypothetical protein EP343_09310 [Deltaproteobacteria bacterium]|nr:MAG: hypothetical protein EP343_09310 [Deltaproteobacteria bacterium]
MQEVSALSIATCQSNADCHKQGCSGRFYCDVADTKTCVTQSNRCVVVCATDASCSQFFTTKKKCVNGSYQ